jgi:hypothetical protein
MERPMTKVKQKQRFKDAFVPSRVTEQDADARTITPNSLLTSEMFAARVKIHPQTARLWRTQGRGPKYKILNPDAAPERHVIRYLWSDVLAWMDGPAKELPPDPATLSPDAKIAHVHSRSSTLARAQYETGGTEALGMVDSATMIEDEDEDPHAITENSDAS